MSAQDLRGKPVQETLLEEVKATTAAVVAAGQRPPHLTAVLVGDDPASAIYVRTKTRKCDDIGCPGHALRSPWRRRRAIRTPSKKQ